MNIYITPQDVKSTGAYTPGVKVGDLLFISGQGTFDPTTGEKFLGAIEKQAVLAMENVKRVVEGANLKMENIVKVTIFLTNIKDFSDVNTVYARYFEEGKYPARSTVGVKELPGGMNIEIEAICSLE